MPKHDREQCLKLARRKAIEAKRALGDPIALVERGVSDLFRLEAPMDMFVRLGSRLNRNLPGPDCDSVLAMVNVKLGTMMASKGFKTSRNPQEGPRPPRTYCHAVGQSLSCHVA